MSRESSCEEAPGSHGRSSVLESGSLVVTAMAGRPSSRPVEIRFPLNSPWRPDDRERGRPPTRPLNIGGSPGDVVAGRRPARLARRFAAGFRRRARSAMSARLNHQDRLIVSSSISSIARRYCSSASLQRDSSAKASARAAAARASAVPLPPGGCAICQESGRAALRLRSGPAPCSSRAAASNVVGFLGSAADHSENVHSFFASSSRTISCTRSSPGSR